MTLSSQFVAGLQQVVGQTHRQIVLTENQRTLRCDVDAATPLAATVYRLSVETPELAAVDTRWLESASADLARRVNYLLEPVAPIEVDELGSVVQMRSNPPRKHEEGRIYYELLVSRGGSISLSRYEKRPGAVRTKIPAVLTHEVLGRLTDDFCQTIQAG
jgi:hypothetical protein